MLLVLWCIRNIAAVFTNDHRERHRHRAYIISAGIKITGPSVVYVITFDFSYSYYWFSRAEF